MVVGSQEQLGIQQMEKSHNDLEIDDDGKVSEIIGISFWEVRKLTAFISLCYPQNSVLMVYTVALKWGH